jgi:hypothetical protein
MIKQTLVRVSFLALLALAPLSGCGGDDNEADRNADVAGTYVGKVAGTKAFVAVDVSPAGKDQDRRNVTVFVCDARRLCESFRSSATGNDFAATSDDDDAKAEGTLGSKAVTGTVELPDGKKVRYKASQATATAGVYELTVSSGGKLRGASAAGVGLKGESTVPEPGSGRLRLADGRRLKFDVTTPSADAPIRLRAGEVRVIVLSGGQLRGVGRTRRNADGGGSYFFIRSAK